MLTNKCNEVQKNLRNSVVSSRQIGLEEITKALRWERVERERITGFIVIILALSGQGNHGSFGLQTVIEACL